MLIGLHHFHSSLRYLILALIIATVVHSLMRWNGTKPFTASSKRISLFTLIFTHIQLLLGLMLYFMGTRGLNALLHVDGVMSDPTARFFAVEHITGMLIAIALITIGYVKSKNAETDKAKFQNLAVYYGISLLIIFYLIPWPFMKEFGTWM